MLSLAELLLVSLGKFTHVLCGRTDRCLALSTIKVAFSLALTGPACSRAEQPLIVLVSTRRYKRRKIQVTSLCPAPRADSFRSSYFSHSFECGLESRKTRENQRKEVVGALLAACFQQD